MTRKSKKRKLDLKKKSVRTLTDSGLAKIVGGTEPSVDVCVVESPPWGQGQYSDNCDPTEVTCTMRNTGGGWNHNQQLRNR